MRKSRQSRSIFLKQCPRCNGDVGIGSDQYGSYVHCLQCGYMKDVGYIKHVKCIPSSTIRDNVA